MNEKEKLQEAISLALQNKENLKEAIPYKRIDLVVNKLINTNLELDRDKEKAWDTLKAYDNFKKIAYDFVDVPYNIQQLGVQGMEECYSYLCKLLKVDKLY